MNRIIARLNKTTNYDFNKDIDIIKTNLTNLMKKFNIQNEIVILNNISKFFNNQPTKVTATTKNKPK